MKTLKQLERLRKAHKLIQNGNTGTPKEFANKLYISEREIYRILEYLKEVDAIICFSRNANSYYYTADFDLLVNVSVKVMVKEEVRTIYAGSIILDKYFETRPLNNLTDGFWQ
jgi:predicted DNA-binding transcriptional regulator YafY